MCMHFAISMLFMDMVLTIDTKLQCSRYTIFFWFANHARNYLFHVYLHGTHIIASINLTTVLYTCVTSKQVT